MAFFQVSHYSQCLHRTVAFHVVLPCDGNRNAKHPPYKTLYLLHGIIGSKNEWMLGSALTELSKMFDIAIIMPSGENCFYIDNPDSGQYFGTYIGKELVEYTRRIFPLSGRRDDTVIGGLSMGAFGALHNSFMHPETFGHCLAISTPLMMNIAYTSDDYHFMGICKSFLTSVFGDLGNVRNTDSDIRHLVSRVKATGATLPELYIACGYNDMLCREDRKFHRFLNELGIPHIYEEGPGTHEWAFWAPYLSRGLEKTLGISERYVPPRKLPFWIEPESEEVD